MNLIRRIETWLFNAISQSRPTKIAGEEKQVNNFGLNSQKGWGRHAMLFGHRYPSDRLRTPTL